MNNLELTNTLSKVLNLQEGEGIYAYAVNSDNVLLLTVGVDQFECTPIAFKLNVDRSITTDEFVSMVKQASPLGIARLLNLKPRIINLTQHAPTGEQIAGGVEELKGDDVTTLKGLLNFTVIPTAREIDDRVEAIADLAVKQGRRFAMVGGAPYLMGGLEYALKARGIQPLYAFTERRSVETTDPDTGEVRKTSIFQHVGWVEV